MEQYNNLGEKCFDDILIYIRKKKPDIILWWHISIPSKAFERIIKSSNTKNIYYNWDDPFNYDLTDMSNKAKYIDMAFISCKETIGKYMNDGTKHVICLYPGFDPFIHYPLLEDNQIQKYECDISICCTNLYDSDMYAHQYIKRKDMIDNIYSNIGKYKYKFFIYGPLYLKELYPDAYKGLVKYEDTNLVFNYSKINICTHVLCDKDGYLNERVILILASGGLLFVDNIKGIEKELKHMGNCFIFDKEDYLLQIVSILADYNKYWLIRHNAYKLSKKYRWEKWADSIHNGIKILK